MRAQFCDPHWLSVFGYLDRPEPQASEELPVSVAWNEASKTEPPWVITEFQVAATAALVEEEDWPGMKRW